jgi:hypothetical protein
VYADDDAFNAGDARTTTSAGATGPATSTAEDSAVLRISAVRERVNHQPATAQELTGYCKVPHTFAGTSDRIEHPALRSPHHGRLWK